MKKIIIALSGILAITFALLIIFEFTDSDTNACQKQQAAVNDPAPVNTVDSTWLICEGHVGHIEINMDVARLEKLFGKANVEEKLISAEGDGSKMVSVNVDGIKDAIMIEPLCTDVCLVSRIFVNSNKYKTKEGICVGSTFADLKKTYSVKSLTGNENGGVFVYTEQLSQIEFEFKPAGLKTHPGKVHNVLEIPDATPVSMIYMY